VGIRRSLGEINWYVNREETISFQPKEGVCRHLASDSHVDMRQPATNTIAPDMTSKKFWTNLNLLK